MDPVTQFLSDKIADLFDYDTSSLTDDTSLTDDLGMDSVERTELAVAIERRFKVKLHLNAKDIETVGDVVARIRAATAGVAS